MMRYLVGMVVLGVLLVMPGANHAQILGSGVTPTFEVSPMQESTLVTSIQSTVTAIEAVIQSAYMLLDLTPVDEIALSAEFVGTMSLLFEIAAEGQMLMQDVEAAAADFEAIFGLEHTDITPWGIQERHNLMTEQLFLARRYAIRTQSLIAHIAGAVQHVQRLVELMGILAGNMQGQQIQIQLLAQANQTLQTQTLQQAADQRIRVLEGARRETFVIGWNQMQQSRWDGWPTLGEVGQ